MRPQKLSRQPRMPTMYDRFDFGEYAFREYPKWVKSPADGKAVVVNNSAEEKELLNEKPENFVSNHKPEPEKDERVQLMDRANDLGLEVDGRMSLARLRALIKEADSGQAA